MKPYRQYISGIRDNVSRSLDVHNDQNQQNHNFVNQNNSFNQQSFANNYFGINLNNSYSHQNNQQSNAQSSNRYKQSANYGINSQERRVNQKRQVTNNVNKSYNGLVNRGGNSQNGSLNQSPQYQIPNQNNTISYEQDGNSGTNVIFNNYLNNTINVDRDVRKQAGHIRSYSSTNNYNEKQERLKSVYGQRQSQSSMDNSHPAPLGNNQNHSLFVNGIIQSNTQNTKSHSLNPSRNGTRGIEEQQQAIPNNVTNSVTPNKMSSLTPRENNVLRKLNVNGMNNNSQNRQKRTNSPKSNGIQINNLNNIQIQIPHGQSGLNSRNGQRAGLNMNQKQILMKNRQNSKHNYTFTNYLNMGNSKNTTENGNNILNTRIQIATPSTNTNSLSSQAKNNSTSKNASSKAFIQQLIKNQQQQMEQGQKKQLNKVENQEYQNQQKLAKQQPQLNGIGYNIQKMQAQQQQMQQLNQAPRNMQEYLQENSIEHVNKDGSLSANTNSKENSRPNQNIQNTQLNILNQKRNSFENQNKNSNVSYQRRLKSSQGKYGRGASNENSHVKSHSGAHSSLDNYKQILEAKERNENTMRRSLNISTIDNSMLEYVKPTFKLNISYRTKQGVLASNPNKTNQDSYIIQQNLMNKNNQHFYAVCDGHGTYGHHVSQFIKQQLPVLLQNDWQLLSNNPKAALYNAIGFANHKLSLTDIDCMFSGTTLVSVLLQGTKLYSANVGDSRATIGRLDQRGPVAKYVPRALTRDHKPNIQTEAERIIQCGGRIDTFRDQEGNHLGPLRVWLKTENIPGLAMSRSIGDNLATSVGVTWEPEIFEFDIDKDDKFMIVASDGVWEFIENEEIISMISPYYDNNDLEGACDHLLKESHARWTVDDDSVVDDITFILIFFEHDNLQSNSRPNSRSSSSQNRNPNYLFHSIDNSYLSYNNQQSN
ncbi:protein phosphatase 2c (macronuclear) [Tetrahymena thermophila SB210]|uniref:Protein phosphatase 2c n=1 Tax=Tetrahymena thermophila (strain SB210) TaxID=312017 RepID=I7MJK6_TETTS|nr:protein phosphatase 2c [Tetrahymena thermophila SB210]EAS06704.1 protein phosphatase 2c [Tetrahymena thermophila SB210]|eukprot:XP_001026946.1 protein phosphatase 2c [Tetrahymena thermophila SB210]